jgi:hypothetical protein
VTETSATDRSSTVTDDPAADHTYAVGDLVRFRIGADPNDQKCSDTFVVQSVVFDKDGSVRWYDCFGGDATDREGVRMHRSFRPERIRPETRKHVLVHRHRPGKGLHTEEDC